MDPVLLAIATALATKAAGGLYDVVASIFHRHPKVATALAAANGAAPDSPPVHALAERLAEVEAAEPEFRDRLRTEWADVQAHADHDGVVNHISGNVTGQVVQARDIQGGISFGGR